MDKDLEMKMGAMKIEGKEREGEVEVEVKEGEGEIEVKKGEGQVEVKEAEVEGKEGKGEVEVEDPIPADFPFPYSKKETAVYVKALIEFKKSVAPVVNMPIAVLHSTPDQNLAASFRDDYEELLLDLLHRPKLVKMSVQFGVDELATFCQAVKEGWRLWRGEVWVGIQKMIDYLADHTQQEDIKRMEVPFLLTVKDIATFAWKSEDEAGRRMAGQAKKIIFLYKTTLPGFPVASTSTAPPPPASAIALEMASSLVQTRGEICRGVDCLEVEEGFVKFDVCSKCRKEPYHSRECQLKAWKRHKKVCNKAKV